MIRLIGIKSNKTYCKDIPFDYEPILALTYKFSDSFYDSPNIYNSRKSRYVNIHFYFN